MERKKLKRHQIRRSRRTSEGKGGRTGQRGGKHGAAYGWNRDTPP